VPSRWILERHEVSFLSFYFRRGPLVVTDLGAEIEFTEGEGWRGGSDYFSFFYNNPDIKHSAAGPYKSPDEVAVGIAVFSLPSLLPPFLRRRRGPRGGSLLEIKWGDALKSRRRGSDHVFFLLFSLGRSYRVPKVEFGRQHQGWFFSFFFFSPSFLSP